MRTLTSKLLLAMVCGGLILAAPLFIISFWQPVAFSIPLVTVLLASLSAILLEVYVSRGSSNSLFSIPSSHEARQQRLNFFMGGSILLVQWICFCQLSISGSSSSLLFLSLASTMIVFGIAIRALSIKSLGSQFTNLVLVDHDGPLVQNGVYRFFRHPSETGIVLFIAGIALVSQSWLALLVFAVVVLPIMILRLRLEEYYLVEMFGKAYEDYQKKTFQLFPPW